MKGESPILVTGACGWIGREVCRWLKANEHPVIACDLLAQAGPWDHFVTFDISDPLGIPDRHCLGGFQSKLEDAVLIHCAGYAHRPIETAEEVRRFFAINADGTKRVVEWCTFLGLKRIVYLSSIAFYDWQNLQKELPVDESAPLGGTTAYAQSKLLGERHIQDSGLDYRIVRLATVFGEGDRANFATLAKAMKQNRFVIPGPGNARKSLISVERAAELISRYALLLETRHRIVNLGFPNAPCLAEICEAYHRICGFPSPYRLPLIVLNPLSLLGNVAALVMPRFPLTTKNMGKLTQSSWVECSKAMELFPGLADDSFVKALEDAAEYYKNL